MSNRNSPKSQFPAWQARHKHERFVRISRSMKESPAWKSLGGNAILLYLTCMEWTYDAESRPQTVASKKLYNAPFEMSRVKGVWFIMGRVPFEKQFPWFAGLLWNNKNHSCMSVVFDCCFPLWSCSALLPVKWPFRTSNTWYIYIYQTFCVKKSILC